MKGSVIALDHVDGRPAAAYLVDGQLEDVLIDPPSVHPRVGTVFRAIARRPMKGQGGVFVDLGGGLTGYLRQVRGVSPGQALLVSVSGFAAGGKAIPVTARLSIRGRHVVITPGAPGRNVSRLIRDPQTRSGLEAIAAEAGLPDEIGLILRSRASGADPEAVRSELEALERVAVQIWSEREGQGAERLFEGPDPHEIAWIDWPDVDAVEEGGFDHLGVRDALDALRGPHVALPSGGSMAIEATRAVVAVDVDTGGASNPAAALSTNIEAARALPRALRCRGLGGQIVVDFAPSPKRDRHRIEQVMQAAFRGDPEETALVGWTALGLFEMQRKRGRLPIAELL